MRALAWLPLLLLAPVAALAQSADPPLNIPGLGAAGPAPRAPAQPAGGNDMPAFSQSALPPLPAGSPSAGGALPAPAAAPQVQAGPRVPTGPAPVPPGGRMPDRAVDQVLEKARETAQNRINAISPEGLPTVDVSGIGNELDSMATKQRRIRELKTLNLEADEIKKLYSTLYGPDSMIGQNPAKAAAAQTPQVTEQEIQKRIDAKVAEALAAAEVARKESEQNAPRPVVAMIKGTGSSRTADVMIPCAGEQRNVRAGDRIGADGEVRVLSITKDGVRVRRHGAEFMLAFADTVPARNCNGLPSIAAAAQAAPRGRPVPLLNAPLPISGTQALPR